MPIDDIFSVQVTFRMIVFTILLDENRLFAKHWHTDSQTHGPMLIAMKKKACCLNSNRFILCGLWGHAVNSMLTNAVLFVIRYHHHTFCHSVSSPYFLSFGIITILFIIRYHHTFYHSVSPYFLSFGIITILFIIRYHHHTFPLSLIKSKHKLCSNVEFSYDIRIAFCYSGIPACCSVLIGQVIIRGHDHEI